MRATRMSCVVMSITLAQVIICGVSAGINAHMVFINKVDAARLPL